VGPATSTYKWKAPKLDNASGYKVADTGGYSTVDDIGRTTETAYSPVMKEEKPITGMSGGGMGGMMGGGGMSGGAISMAIGKISDATAGLGDQGGDGEITGTQIQNVDRGIKYKGGIGLTRSGADHQRRNKNEIAAGALGGFDKGFHATYKATGGSWLASLIGGSIAATRGGLQGIGEKKKRIEGQHKRLEEMLTQDKNKKAIETQAEDMAKLESISKVGYAKKGGILKYTNQEPIILAPIEALKIPAKKAVEVAPIFRRGGALETQKKNVIVDGPSHDEENNTGKKGDKGLPVVKDGVKVAEIESNELVIHAEASAELLALYKEYKKTEDPAIKKKLEAVIKKELTENTYDYSGLHELTED